MFRGRFTAMKARWVALIASLTLLIGVGITADVVAFATGQSNAAFALLGDVLIFIGLPLSYLIFRTERLDARKRDRKSVLAMLRAAHAIAWGNSYFTAYDDQAARFRAKDDFRYVMAFGYGQVKLVPVEPLTALIEHQGNGGLVRQETIEAANEALWYIGAFNQLVQQQTDFNTHHAAEIADRGLSMGRRLAIAHAAEAISVMLHRDGIGDAGWYKKLKAALETNIKELRRD